MPGEEPFMVSTYSRAREGGGVRLGGSFSQREIIKDKYQQQGQGRPGRGGVRFGRGGRSLWGGPLPKENDPIFKTVGKNSTN